MSVGPLGLATGTLEIVTLFRTDDAAVTLRQALETGITIALVEALPGQSATIAAIYVAEVLQRDALAQECIERIFLVIENQRITHWVAGFGTHLA
jgi:hypothetical protein